MEKRAIVRTAALLSLLLVALLALAACDGGLETVPQSGVQPGQEGTGVVTDANVTDASVATDTTGIAASDVVTSAPSVENVQTFTETGQHVVTDTVVVTAVTDVVTNVTVIEDVTSSVTVTAEAPDINVSEAGVTTTESVTTQESVTDTAATGMSAGSMIRSGAGVTGAGGVLVTASSLDGYNFDDINGEGVGEVGGILLDPQTGQIQYLLVNYGGFLTLGQSQVPVPLNAFTMVDNDTLVANFDQNVLEQYPVTNDDWLADNTWGPDTANFWGDLGFGETAFGDAVPTVTVGDTQLVRVEDIIGRQAVLATEADDMANSGNIEDLLLDLQRGYAKYLLVDVADIEVDGMYVLPFNALSFTQVGDSYALNSDFDRGWLADAPVTNRAFLTDPTADPDIAANNDAYWGERGFFSGWGVNQ